MKLTVEPKRSGSKDYYKCTGNERDLRNAARVARTDYKGQDGNNPPHLDLSGGQLHRITKVFGEVVFWGLLFVVGMVIGNLWF